MQGTTIVVATRNRWSELRTTLRSLTALAGRPPVIVVDNASSDGTPALVRRCYPEVGLVALPGNIGAAARTVGARQASTPWVAFCDDDSWWDADALTSVEALLAADPYLALVAARVVVEPAGDADPTSVQMGDGDLDEWLRVRPDGRRGITGFLACSAVVRRSAYLAVGGFEEHFVIGGEEEPVALDLASAGWKLVYAPEATVRHRPSAQRHAADRRRRLARNALLTALMRYSTRTGGVRLVGVSCAGLGDAAQWRALGDAAASAGWALARRRGVPGHVERAFVAAPTPRVARGAAG